MRQRRHPSYDEEGAARTGDPLVGRAPGQNAPVPFGVPRPVGPSQPERALHHWVVGQVPLLPLVMSLRLLVCSYGVELL